MASAAWVLADRFREATTMIDSQELPAALQDRLCIFPAAVARPLCEAIVQTGDALSHAPGPLHNNLTGERFYDASIRLTSVGWLSQRDWVFELMQAFADRVNADWNYDLSDADDLQYALYRRNDFFECHQDMLRVRGGPIRKVSVVLQLSDPATYRGGALQFLDDDAGFFEPAPFAPQGSVAVFSSLLKHRVTPIKEGERRSLTAWFKGPAFR